ncbi:putative DNA-binding transcriptional regulator AlpA [Bradyrhizobium sp. USDA 4516]
MMTDDHPADKIPNTSVTTDPDDLELWDRQTVQKFFGGTKKPIHLSTLYRGIASGLYPPPVNVGGNVARWVGQECRAARQRMLAARTRPVPTTLPRRGRPPKKREAAAPSGIGE